jgi:hypothetical protein
MRLNLFKTQFFQEEAMTDIVTESDSSSTLPSTPQTTKKLTCGPVKARKAKEGKPKSSMKRNIKHEEEEYDKEEDGIYRIKEESKGEGLTATELPRKMPERKGRGKRFKREDEEGVL